MVFCVGGKNRIILDSADRVMLCLEMGEGAKNGRFRIYEACSPDDFSAAHKKLDREQKPILLIMANNDAISCSSSTIRRVVFYYENMIQLGKKGTSILFLSCFQSQPIGYFVTELH